MFAFLQRLKGRTIWADGAIPASEGSASREMKRVVLPAYDGVVALTGITAVVNGMPSFHIAFDPFISTTFGWTLLASAITAFVGLAFPKLWKVEAAGKIGILGVTGGYSMTMWGLVIFQGDVDRSFVAGAFTALLILPLWNLARLGRERRKRRRQRLLKQRLES